MRRAAGMVALGLALFAGACAKQSGHEAAATPAYAAPGMSLDEYERLLAQNEVALRQQGVRIPPSGTKVALADTPARGDEAAAGADYDDAVSEQGEAEGPVVGGAVTAEEPTPEARPEAQTAQPAPFPAAEESVEREEADYAAAPEGRARRSNRAKRGVREQTPDRCEMICDLAAATCDLEAKICALASEHPEDARYQDACERANRDCDIAQEACLECAE
jgi:hypothetical protein